MDNKPANLTSNGNCSPILRTSLRGPEFSISSLAVLHTPDDKLYQSHINAQSTPLMLNSLGIQLQTVNESWQSCMATPPAIASKLHNNEESNLAEDISLIFADSELFSEADTSSKGTENLPLIAEDPKKPQSSKRIFDLSEVSDLSLQEGSSLQKTPPKASVPAKRGKFIYPIENPSFHSGNRNGSRNPAISSTTPSRKLPKSKRALPFKAPRVLNDLTLNPVETRVKNIQETVTKPVSSVNPFITAGGKSLQVSETGLEIAKETLESFHQEENYDVCLTQSDKTSNNTTYHNLDPTQATSHLGFSTAGGKALKVSESSLLAAKHTFNRLDLSEDEISNKAQKISADVEQMEVTNTSEFGQETLTVGFSTAGGKVLAVSEKNLEVARRGFQEWDVPNVEEVDENDVFFSDETNFEKILEPQIVPKIDAMAFLGFATAAGKSLFVDEKALKTAEERFLAIQTDKEPSPEITDPSVTAPNSQELVRISPSYNSQVALVEDVVSHDLHPVSPKLGRRKKKKHVPKPMNEFPEFLDPSTESQQIFLEADPTFVKPEVLERRKQCRERQLKFIESKRDIAIRAKQGSLFQQKCNAVYTLKDLAPPSLQYCTGKLVNMCKLTAQSAQGYSFGAWELFPAEIYRENCEGIEVGANYKLILSNTNSIGFNEISAAFLASEGVAPSLLHPDWLLNHYKFILWKLASLERRFPDRLQCFDPSHVLAQLKYRYDREIDLSQRPILRKLSEQDDSAQRPMILLISAINSIDPCVVEVSDGWYAIKAQVDTALSRFIAQGKLEEGTKIIVQGSKFASLFEPCHPLDLPSDVCLSLSANSVRRVRWDAKLGLIKKNLRIGLETIVLDGGKTAVVRACIARCYPFLYMVKDRDGKKEFLSERMYGRRLRDEEKQQEKFMEGLYSQVAREFELKAASHERFEEEDFLYLSDVERKRKMEQLGIEREQRACDIRDEVRRRAGTVEKECMVTPIWKLFLVSPNWPKVKNTAVVTVWRPTEDTQSEVKEGGVYDIYGLTPRGLRLAATYKTRFERVNNPVDENLKRRVCPLGALHEDFRLAGEVDIVGFVSELNPAEEGQQSFVMEDGNCNRALVYVKGDLESLGLSNLVKVGECLGASNLSWKGTVSNKYALPCLIVQDVTNLTDRPSQNYLKEALVELRRSIKVAKKV